MLTSQELALAGAVLPLIGIVIGWALSRTTASATVREQRRLEGRRRQDDRRLQLYLDLLSEADKLTRWQEAYDGERLKPEERSDGRAERLEQDWRAKVTLFASPEVNALWDKWMGTFAEHGLVEMAPAKSNDDMKSIEIRNRTDMAYRKLVAQMRLDLDSWTSE